MALSEGQVQVRDLVMGPGTPYTIMGGFNPWTKNARADQSDSRAWNDGSWSGAEWSDEVVVPLPILVQASGASGWMAAHQTLVAAFAPSHTDVELRWMLGGTEYVMFGRPRMVEPQTANIGVGLAHTRCAFVALDPAIYSGVEHSVTLGLPSTTGGLTFPITFPLTFPATVTSGRQTITNAGTKTTGLRLRIDGPVEEPRVSLLTSSGTAIVRHWLTLSAGQWLDIDTAARTVYLNGTASRRGLTTADGIGWPLLLPGSWELAFDAAVYDASARLTAYWRDAWH